MTPSDQNKRNSLRWVIEDGQGNETEILNSSSPVPSFKQNEKISPHTKKPTIHSNTQQQRDTEETNQNVRLPSIRNWSKTSNTQNEDFKLPPITYLQSWGPLDDENNVTLRPIRGTPCDEEDNNTPGDEKKTMISNHDKEEDTERQEKLSF